MSKQSMVVGRGVWATGAFFTKLIPVLQADGDEVTAVQYGLDTFAEDVAAVKRRLGRGSSPAILVGHSYGGATITAAGTDDRVKGLVYIAAVADDAGETVQGQLDKYPTEMFSHIEVAGGRVWMLSPEGTRCFAGDLPEQEQKVVWATHYAPAADLFQQQKKVDGIAWKSKPSWFIVAKNDQCVHPDLQRFVAKRMGATIVETNSSHLIMLSHPDLVVDVIRKAPAAVAAKQPQPA